MEDNQQPETPVHNPVDQSPNEVVDRNRTPEEIQTANDLGDPAKRTPQESPSSPAEGEG